MKYINKFENFFRFNRKGQPAPKLLEEGDYVVLIEESVDTKFYNYEVGNIYRIITVDTKDSVSPYELTNKEEDLDVWVSESQVRLAEDYELDANKYNL